MAQEPSCLPLPAHASFTSAVVAPDERDLYVFGDRQLVVLRRDPVSGSLLVIAGSGGCLAAGRVAGCARVPGAAFMRLVLSSDGRNGYLAQGVYAFSLATLRVLRRDAATGALAPLTGRGSCVGTDAGCIHLSSRDPINDWALLPDGRTLLVTSGLELWVMRRNPASGRLSLRAGAAECWGVDPHAACSRLRGLVSDPDAIAVSHDARTVLVDDDESIAILKRDYGAGRLRQLRGRAGCLAPTASRACRHLRGVPDGNAMKVRFLDHDRLAGALDGQHRMRRERRHGRMHRTDRACLTGP